MKYTEINKLYTEKVAGYLAAGYRINTATMNGSQGEIAHIDLTDGNEVIRVLLYRDIEHDEFDSYYRLCLEVGRATDDIRPDSSGDWQTIWNNQLDVISREYFYELYHTKGTAMEQVYGKKIEAIEIGAKRFARYQAKQTCTGWQDITSMEVCRIVTPAIRRNLGVKRVEKQRIQVLRRYNGSYQVRYGNRSLILN